MLCCPSCFDDHIIEERIRRASTFIGSCTYCRANDQPLFDPRELRDDFEAVLGAYREIAEGGQSFADLLREEWGLFPRLDDHLLHSLLDEILGDGVNRKQFSSATSLDQSKSMQWEKFREEIKFRNRFFPESIPDLEDLTDLLGNLKACLDPKDFYRARVETEGLFRPEDMGKPPASVCTGGRANPPGIPYFYIASDASTAIAEVRPHPGDRVTVATFHLNSPMTVLDLGSPRRSISPFGRDADQLIRLRADMEFLIRLSDGLSKPIQPRTAHLEYLPSQYLCEFVKKLHFQGVIYRSAVGVGINIALFEDSQFHCVSISSYEVKRLHIETIPNA